MPSPVRFAEIERLFKKHGWVLDRISSSHHIFKSPTGESYAVPVPLSVPVGKRVKYGYFRTVKKILKEE